MNSLIILGVMVAMIMANVNQRTKVTAETGVGNDVFKVVVTLFGIANSTKDITTLVNVKDESKVKLFNAENPEREDKDTISYTMTFPNLQVNEGDPYTVCTVKVEDFKLNCIDGNRLP